MPMIPAQLLPLLYDDYLGVARKGVVPPVTTHRAVFGRTRIVPKYKGVSELVAKVSGRTRVRPKFSGVYGVVSNEAAIFAAEKRALFGDSLTTLADFQGFITRFVAIIEGATVVSDLFMEYLLTEGWEYDLAEAPEGGTLDARHLLYWLDIKLKENKAAIGYTNRLSEAGGSWGETAPTTLTEADPLDLVTTLEDLGVKVVVVDHDAASSGDNVTVGAQNGCVRIPKTDHVCDTLDGSNKTYQSTDALLNSSNYRYRFWYTLDDLNEANGGKLRFPNAAVESVVLVRYSTAAHEIDGATSPTNSNYIGCTTPGQTQNTRITISGYPGEFPVLQCHNSETTHNNATFLVSPATNKIRKNVHWRNLDFVGKFDTGGGMYEYATRMLATTGNTGTDGTQSADHSIRFCRIREFQAISDADPLAGANSQYVDSLNSTRASGVSYTALDLNSPRTVVDSCYFEPAPVATYPQGVDQNAGRGVGNKMSIDLGSSDADGSRITRCTFAGVSHNSQIRAITSDDLYIAHNDIEVYDKDPMSISGCDNLVIEFNRLHDFANADWELEGGGFGISLAGCQNFTVRYNVIFNHETQVGAAGIGFQATSPYVVNSGVAYGNIFYRCGPYIDHNTTGNGESTTVDFYNNLVAGIQNHRRTDGTPDGVIDGQFLVNFIDDPPVDGSLRGSTLRDNAFWRFPNNDPTGSESGNNLTVRLTTGTSDHYTTADALTGWTGNITEEPAWSGDPENDDLRLDGTNTFAAWFPASMPFRVADSQAWSPS